MPNRREFLQAGLAASMLPVALPRLESPVAAHSEAAAVRAAHAIYKVIADVRFPEGVAFALALERSGARVVRFAGDITAFWFNDLSLRWKEHPVAIAGLTAHGPIFCLERFAWDHGMRVVFREEYPAVHEPLISWVIAPPSRV